MLKFRKTNANSLESMRKSCQKTYTAPMDDMWEQGIIPSGDFYAIEKDIALGYFVLDENNTLLQFFVKKEYLTEANKIFAEILKQKVIKKVFVSTYDPVLLMLCLDHNSSININDILYAEKDKLEIESPLPGMQMQIATAQDLEEVLIYSTEKANLMSGDWLRGYTGKLIARQGLYLFRLRGEIIGAGEMRPSQSSVRYANLGMTVSSDYRKRGIGSYILNEMRQLTNQEGMKAICSTSINNIASQKTIEKAGFYAYHRILEVGL